jgi:hypothetical protein
MGCGSTRPAIHQPDKLNKYLVLKSTPFDRSKAHEAIKKDDLMLFKKLVDSKKITPLEEIGHHNSGTSCLHYAAKCNAFQVLEYMIRWIKEQNPNDFKEIINSPQHLGKTPAMLAAQNDGAESLFLLLLTDAVDYNKKNSKKHTLIHLVKKPKRTRCRCVVDFMTKGTNWNKILNENSTSHNHCNSENVVALIKNTLTPPAEGSSACEDDYAAGAQDAPAPTKYPKNTNKNIVVVTTIDDGLFVDSDFPPSLESICRNKSHNSYQLFTSARWLRPKALANAEKKTTLYDGMDPSDIDQGALGTCYFLCTLAAIAEFPSRLQPIFLSEYNENGQYSVRLFKRGVPTKITVDDLFPCYPDRLMPMFSKTKGSGEIWVMLLEKVWAKIYGDYCVTEYGFMNEAVEDLLGAPSERITPNIDGKADEIWAKLVATDKNRGIMGASTGTADSTDVAKDLGLVNGHAYSLLGVYDEDGYKLVKLRNPWGSFEWKGDFSDDSPLWTEDLKKKVHYVKADDGMFCMKFDDFLKHFQSISLCYYKDNWQYSHIASTSTHNHAQYFEFTLDQATDINLRVHQTDKRMFATETLGDKYQYSGISIVVCKVDDKDPEADYTYISATKRIYSMRSVWASDKPFMSLQAGTYCVKVKTNWYDKKENKFTLSAYAPCKVVFNKIEDTVAYKEVDLCAAAQLQAQEGKLKEIKQRIDAKVGIDYFRSQKVVVYVENNTDKKLTYTVNFTKLDNMRISKLNRISDMQLKIEVSSQSVGYGQLKTINLSQGSEYEYKSAYQFENEEEAGLEESE